MFFDMGGMWWYDDDYDPYYLDGEGAPVVTDEPHIAQPAPVQVKEQPAAVVEGPPRLTVWQTVIGGTTDIRCHKYDVHLHDVLHALGLNPSALWPPESDEFVELLK